MRTARVRQAPRLWVLLSVLLSGCTLVIGELPYQNLQQLEGGTEAQAIEDHLPAIFESWGVDLGLSIELEVRPDLSLSLGGSVLGAPDQFPRALELDMELDMELMDEALPEEPPADMMSPPPLVEPNCDRCLEAQGSYESCRALCMNTFDQQSNGNGYADGTCISEGGADTSMCCACTEPMPFKACSRCLNGHASCVEACNGQAKSYCQTPFSTDSGDCCACFP